MSLEVLGLGELAPTDVTLPQDHGYEKRLRNESVSFRWSGIAASRTNSNQRRRSLMCQVSIQADKGRPESGPLSAKLGERFSKNDAGECLGRMDFGCVSHADASRS